MGNQNVRENQEELYQPEFEDGTELSDMGRTRYSLREEEEKKEEQGDYLFPVEIADLIVSNFEDAIYQDFFPQEFLDFKFFCLNPAKEAFPIIMEEINTIGNKSRYKKELLQNTNPHVVNYTLDLFNENDLDNEDILILARNPSYIGLRRIIENNRLNIFTNEILEQISYNTDPRALDFLIEFYNHIDRRKSNTESVIKPWWKIFIYNPNIKAIDYIRMMHNENYLKNNPELCQYLNKNTNTQVLKLLFSQYINCINYRLLCNNTNELATERLHQFMTNNHIDINNLDYIDLEALLSNSSNNAVNIIIENFNQINFDPNLIMCLFRNTNERIIPIFKMIIENIKNILDYRIISSFENYVPNFTLIENIQNITDDIPLRYLSQNPLIFINKNKMREELLTLRRN